MKASVVIATKNRKGELRVALRSVFEQTVQPEVVVVDDASTDGTAEMVRTEFPSAQLAESTSSIGYIRQRNRAAHLATRDIIFSIDDDAIFASPDTLEQTLREFDHPRVGAVAIPYIEPRKSDIVHQRAPSREDIFVTDSFIGTAHALRKELFLRLGGYREFLVHQGEEMDFCLRLLETGYVVRVGSADPIHHMESPHRDFQRMNFYGRRNDILFAWHNVPMPYLPLHLVGTSLNGLIFSLKIGQPYHALRGISRGYIDCINRWGYRKPVYAGAYRLSRFLKKRGPIDLKQIEGMLPLMTGRIQKYE